VIYTSWKNFNVTRIFKIFYCVA